jgi:large subunit ribosomal protein L4e
MKADIHSIGGKKTGSVELPKQCTATYRPDMILRAFLAYQGNNRQPYGAYPKAGQRASAVLSRRRRKYRGSYGHGISRVPRKALWKRGRQFGWVGAFAPGTVSGRRAHPPKSKKIFAQQLNTKERKQALCSAITSTFNEQLVKQRGHNIEFLPTVIETKVETLTKTKDVHTMFTKLKLHNELKRVSTRKIRAGKGKMRNRKYKTKIGPLVVVSKKCPAVKAARNIPGVDVCQVNNLNINLLAPGGQPGRLTMYSEEALKKMKEEKLFLTTKKEPAKKETKGKKQ